MTTSHCSLLQQMIAYSRTRSSLCVRLGPGSGSYLSAAGREFCKQLFMEASWHSCHMFPFISALYPDFSSALNTWSSASVLFQGLCHCCSGPGPDIGCSTSVTRRERTVSLSFDTLYNSVLIYLDLPSQNPLHACTAFLHSVFIVCQYLASCQSCLSGNSSVGDLHVLW